MKADLFFGYTLVDGLYVAEPEKVLLDQCYLASRGLTSLFREELNLSRVDRGRLMEMAQPFASAVQTQIQAVMRS